MGGERTVLCLNFEGSGSRKQQMGGHSCMSWQGPDSEGRQSAGDTCLVRLTGYCRGCAVRRLEMFQGGVAGDPQAPRDKGEKVWALKEGLVK